MSGPAESKRYPTGDELIAIQTSKLRRLLDEVRGRPFYAAHLKGFGPIESLDQLAELPLLTKADLGQRTSVGHSIRENTGVFDLEPAVYSRLHQTSGTSGFAMPVMDTVDDWTWWLDCWDHVLDAAAVSSRDVAMMAFSFGPFIGFWTANDALVRRGAMVVPGGGMSSQTRLRMIADAGCTVLCCTPTYALHMVAVANQLGIDLAGQTSISRIIVAGEPGGSIASVRSRIESAWGARVVDHVGASEVGAWGFGSRDGCGVHVIESEFIAEILRVDKSHPLGVPVGPGETGELVLTGLGRMGGPVIRYRTGDVVLGRRDSSLPCPWLYLDGGVIGRSDDMMVIRGVNVFPSSIESIVRQVDATAEFRMIATRQGDMDQLAVEIEAGAGGAETLARLLRDRLAIRVDVTSVDRGTLPVFEAKSKRLVDRRFETGDRQP